MPILRKRLPKYRHHKPSGQAVVVLNSRPLYLGTYGSKASRVEYDKRIAEWLANDRQLPNEANELTVVELVNRYWKFAQTYYVKNGAPTGSMYGIRVALRLLRKNYGRTPAAEFGPLALKALRAKMVAENLSRRYINSTIHCIRRVFRWAVEEQLVGSSVYEALKAVPGLKQGRTEARESPPVLPVTDEQVEATLPHLPPIVAAMIKIQQLTGCRPGEVISLRPCDIDRSEDIWIYRPASHKTEHHGRERMIYLGPAAQEILGSYLDRDPMSYCFVPDEAEQARNRERRANRKSPMTPSQRKRRPKANRKRPPGSCYTSNSYRRAIQRACAIAFPVPDDLPTSERGKWVKDHQWHPNRLRHSAATKIRKQFGLEAVQVVLGHSQANVTQIYAERDQSLGLAVMRRIG